MKRWLQVLSVVLLQFQILCLWAVPVSADVRVEFVESAPKDRFIIANIGDCDLKDLTLSIDLSTSSGRLIFDTTAEGAGVEVFQPFDAGTDSDRLDVKTPVIDGDSELSLSIPTLPGSASVGFTIDVDDTLIDSELGQIRVSGSEVAGGRIVLEIGAEEAQRARFDENAQAVLPSGSCP